MYSRETRVLLRLGVRGRLKRELMKVTAERDTLKKALAYFAKESR
jgi:transposase-like protein